MHTFLVANVHIYGSKMRYFGVCHLQRFFLIHRNYIKCKQSVCFDDSVDFFENVKICVK